MCFFDLKMHQNEFGCRAAVVRASHCEIMHMLMTPDAASGVISICMISQWEAPYSNSEYTSVYHFSGRTVPQQFIGRHPVLRRDKLRHGIWIVEERLHTYERLAAFLRQQRPRLWPSEQVADRSLRQTKDCLTEQTLADWKLAQQLLYLHAPRNTNYTWWVCRTDACNITYYV